MPAPSPVWASARPGVGMAKPKPICRICDWRPVHCDDRCITCYQYRRRNGQDRPESVIVRHGQRALERMMASG